MKYRKKPVVVEAIQWNGKNFMEIFEFAGSRLDFTLYGSTDYEPNVDMSILTLEGRMEVSIGDYIIKGVQGEFYPCKPYIFEQTYEVVGNDK